MKKKKEEGHMNHERWLLSYSDFMTLLMILFVVLYAMSNVDKTKFKQLSQSLSIAMSGGKAVIAVENGVDTTENKTPAETELQRVQEEQQLEQLKKQVDSYLDKSGMKGSVSTNIDERGLVVSLNDNVFFDNGKAEIKADWQKKLIDLGKILNQLNNYIRIEGHTDNVPIKNEEFASNWQLSAVRAANVTQFLIDNSNISPQKMSAVGYSQYRPILDNSTEEGRARNRRVDIIIVNSKFDKLENKGIGNNPVTNSK